MLLHVKGEHIDLIRLFPVKSVRGCRINYRSYRCDYSWRGLIAGCLIRGPCCSIGLLVLECIRSFGARVSSVVGSL